MIFYTFSFLRESTYQRAKGVFKIFVDFSRPLPGFKVYGDDPCDDIGLQGLTRGPGIDKRRFILHNSSSSITFHLNYGGATVLERKKYLQLNIFN